jgi:hypothetical protein
MTKIKRRAFIRNTVVTGLGASMLPPGLMAMDNKVKADVISAIPTNSSAKSKIVVAGAGITGLCCAYGLHRLRLQPQLSPAMFPLRRRVTNRKHRRAFT